MTRNLNKIKHTKTNPFFKSINVVFKLYVLFLRNCKLINEFILPLNIEAVYNVLILNEFY